MLSGSEVAAAHWEFFQSVKGAAIFSEGWKIGTAREKKKIIGGEKNWRGKKIINWRKNNWLENAEIGGKKWWEKNGGKKWREKILVDRINFVK
jgi:hypothetical protein